MVTAGSGRYRHGTEAFPVATGDIFAAFPGVPHEISSYETGDLELYFLRFVISRVDLAAAEGGRNTQRLSAEERVMAAFDGSRLRASHGEPFWPFIPLIASLTQMPPSTMIAKAGESTLLHLTLAMMERLGKVSELVTEPSEPTLWERARNAIESQVELPMDTETLAEKLGVCSRTLRRAAQRETGQGIAAEMNQIRMMHASHRLLMGFSVAEVATQFHFSEPAVFTRCFRRVVGTSPSDFKRNYQLGHHAVSPRNDNQKLNKR